MNDFKERVDFFNEKAGNKLEENSNSVKFWDNVKTQTKLLVEESTEARDAANNYDKKELLDGTIDSLVIAFRLYSMLEAAGFDVSGATDEICSNNDSKVFDVYWEAVEAKEQLEDRDGVEYTIATSLVDGCEFYTVRRFDNKIMKYVDFWEVDLSKYIPKEEQVVHDTLDIQISSLNNFMESLGYSGLAMKDKVVFTTNIIENKHHAVISFNSAIRLHNSMFSRKVSIDEKTGDVIIGGFKFKSFLYNKARASQFVAEVGLHIVNENDSFVIKTSKDFVYFVNGSEFMYNNKDFLKEDYFAI